MKTRNSILNFISTYVFYILKSFLDIYKVALFTRFFGVQIDALNHLFVNIFSYISIVESGIGVAIIYRLYRPLADRDEKEVNRLYTSLAYSFRIVGYIIIGISLVVVFFIPKLIADYAFDFKFVFISFTIYILRNIITYFMCAPRFVMMADHKQYKSNIILYGGQVLEQIIEIMMIKLASPYYLYLLPAVFIRILQNWLINRKVFREYPWLRKSDEPLEDLRGDMSNLIVIRAVNMVHKSSDTIILSALVGSLVTSIYSKYYKIVTFCFMTCQFLYSSIKHGMGQFIVKADTEDALKEMARIRVLFSFVGVCFVVMLHYAFIPFVEVWVGELYVVDNRTLWLFLALIYCNTVIYLEQMLVEIFGLFDKVRIPGIIAAVLNLAISLLLVNRFGIAGVLLGTIISDMIIYVFQYSYTGYRKLTGGYKLSYFIYNLYNVIIVAIVSFIFDRINLIKLFTINGYMDWFKYAVVNSLACLALICVLFVIFYRNDFLQVFTMARNVFRKKLGKGKSE